MAPLVLAKRATGLRERMDDPACSLERLHTTYRHFQVVNQVLAGWRRIYERWLRPHLASRPATLLDVGCGGGDVVRRLALWAQQDGLELRITAVDPDVRAMSYVETRRFPPNITFRQAHTSSLDERFDVVISNHLLHHLTHTELLRLCEDSSRLAKKLVVHNDIRRGDLAYLGFALTRLLFHRSFITEDGLASIRRSFTPDELRRSVPAGWTVETLAPYRNLLIHRP